MYILNTSNQISALCLEEYNIGLPSYAVGKKCIDHFFNLAHIHIKYPCSG
jgi:hypothetical protein